MDESIVSALCSRAGQMAPTELRALRQLLGVAISGLDAERALPAEERKRAAVRAIQDSLFRLTSFRGHIPDDGVLWHGRPPFMIASVLEAVQQRARLESANKVRNGKHFFVECPSLVELLPRSALVDFLHGIGPDLEPTGKANLQYYEAAGECVGAHVDVDDFVLSGIMLVRHEHEEQCGSRLWVFPRGDAPKSIELEPGEMVLLYANAVIHQRTPVALGERVTTLAIGISRNHAAPACEQL